MLSKVRRYIESMKLLDASSKYLVALSGGADSVCLLLVLRQLGYSVEAVHCNFHLRGAESDRDEAFCRELCAEHGVPFHVVHFDTRTYAELHKVSIEMAARDLRYGYFENLRRDIEASDICVAHHKDDNVETVLMNIIRGTGIKGLIGIRPRNGHIVRPLLCVSREEITAYLNDCGQSFVTDSSNLINDVTRNKLRLDVIPLLRKINPQMQENVVRMTEWLTDVECITEQAVADIAKAACRWDDGEAYDIDADNTEKEDVLHVSLPCIADAPSPRYVLFSVLQPLGFTTEQIVDAARQHTIGTKWQSRTHTLVVDRDELLIAKTPRESPVSLRIPEDGNYVVSQNAKMKLHFEEVTADFRPSREPLIATFDASKVRFPLTLRNIQPGDRFAPFGMKGTKLVSDYLNDRKRNYFQRLRQLVLVDASGEIIWLVGERVSSRACISGSTIKCLYARYYINE